MDNREQQRRERAYKLWEDEGRPEGAHEDHWQRAEDQHELTEQQSDNVTKVNQRADESLPKMTGLLRTPPTSSLRRLSARIKEHAMTDLKKRDKVTWKTSQGKTEGRVVKKQTSDTKINGHRVKASKDDPQIIVESDKSGKRAAHRPEALKNA